MNQPQPFDLLRETVGKPLKKAMQDLGCPLLPQGLLTTEHRVFLDAKLDRLPSDLDALDRLVVKQAMNGKVIRVGHAPAGESLFTVRFPLQKAACVITFAYYRDQWSVHSIDAIQTRAFQLSRVLIGGAVGSAVSFVVAFLLFGTPGDDIVAQANKEGYVVLTKEQYEAKTGEPAPVQSGETKAKTAPGTSVPATATPADTNSADKDKNGNDPKKDQEADASVSFTLQSGMTVNDLTTFLKQEGLIADQAAFNQKLTQEGIDTKIQPKTYNFKKGMTEQEVLNVLQG